MAFSLATRFELLSQAQKSDDLVVERSPKPNSDRPIVHSVLEPTETDKLQKLITDFQATQPTTFYIYAKNLKTGTTAVSQPEASIPSGSIYKMFLANQVYKLNEAGQLNMSTSVRGTGYNFSGCTMQMVQNSLNACGEAVRTQLGPAEQTAALNGQGYTCTNLMLNDAAHTCAKDVALIYERLYYGGYYSPEHTEQFLGYLRKQLWRFRIPTGIPVHLLASSQAITYNKTGDVYGYANDSAIVKGENTDFLLVVLSGPWNKVFPDSSYAIRHLSGELYNFFNGTSHTLPY